jgi:hypothetical protein
LPLSSLALPAGAAMRVNNTLNRNKASSPEEIAKDKSNSRGKKQKGWLKHLDDDAEDDASSALSDISTSTDGEVGDYLGSIDEHSEDYQRFEKKLRNKHARACNAMSVSSSF